MEKLTKIFLGFILIASTSGCISWTEGLRTEETKQEFIRRCLDKRPNENYMCECIAQKLFEGENNWEAAINCSL